MLRCTLVPLAVTLCVWSTGCDQRVAVDDAGERSDGGGTLSDSDAGPDAALCMIAGTKLCERACACDPSEGCSVESPAGSELHFDDFDDCSGLYVRGNCISGGSPLIDYTCCFEDIDPVECSAAGDAVVIPASCTEGR